MKYINVIKGNVTGIVQGDGATVIIRDGEVIAARSNRLVKCKACKELVAEKNYCTQCGARL